jgi:hypothetical protein
MGGTIPLAGLRVSWHVCQTPNLVELGLASQRRGFFLCFQETQAVLPG